MKRFVLAILALSLCFGVASCDSTPAGPPTATCTEVARVPLDGLGAQGTPYVFSIGYDATRIALSVRVGGPADQKDVLKLYDTTQKQWVEPSFPVPAGEELNAIQFSPDGRYQVAFLLQPPHRRVMRVFAEADMHECFAFETGGGGHGLLPIAFAPNGRSMLRPDPPARGKPFSFVIVDLETGAVQSTLNVDVRLLSFGVIQRMAFTPNGKWVYGHQANRVLVWDVASGQQVAGWPWPGTGAVAAIGCTPDSRFVRAVMEEGTIMSFDLMNGSKEDVDRLEVPKVDLREPRIVPFVKPWSFNRAAFSLDASRVLRDAGGRIEEYDVRSRKLIRTLTLPADAAHVNFDARRDDLLPVHIGPGGGSVVAIVRIPK